MFPRDKACLHTFIFAVFLKYPINGTQDKGRATVSDALVCARLALAHGFRDRGMTARYLSWLFDRSGSDVDFAGDCVRLRVPSVIIELCCYRC